MLQLTGKCCSGPAAVEFFETLAEIIPEDDRTEEFCERYEEALNRLRYEVGKSVPVPMRIRMGKRWHEYVCGKCGSVVGVHEHYCHNCGTNIKWDFAG